MDVGNGVLQFERTILSATVKPAQPQHASSTDQYDLFIFEIKGLAFLYHQVPGESYSSLLSLYPSFLANSYLNVQIYRNRIR